MPCEMINNATDSLTGLQDMAGKFFPYAEEQLGFDQNVKIIFVSDEDNASNVLGKTAYYNPTEMAITLFTTGRHPKDVLRSLSHELVHHTQNCRGDFDQDIDTSPGYAQKDDTLREMEREAYELGNMIFRDWEDGFKQQNNLEESMNIEIEIDEGLLRETIRKGLKKMMLTEKKGMLNEIGFPFFDVPSWMDIPYIEPTEWADKAAGVVGDVLSEPGVQLGLEALGCFTTGNPWLCAMAAAEAGSIVTGEEKLSPTHWAIEAAKKGGEQFLPSEIAREPQEIPADHLAMGTREDERRLRTAMGGGKEPYPHVVRDPATGDPLLDASGKERVTSYSPGREAAKEFEKKMKSIKPGGTPWPKHVIRGR